MNRKKQPRHGTISTYTNYKCRCPLCRAAAAAYQKRSRDRRAAEMSQ